MSTCQQREKKKKKKKYEKNVDTKKVDYNVMLTRKN